MNAFSFLVPIIILACFIYGIVRKIDLYEAFSQGVKQAVPLILTIFPYLAAIFVMTELMDKSGVSNYLINLLSPIFKTFGIPDKLAKLVLLKPFSGSGSFALLSEIYAEHGVDSYIAKCASCIFGSSETIFYVCAVYLSSCKDKNILKPVIISLISCFISCIAACFICRFI